MKNNNEHNFDDNHDFSFDDKGKNPFGMPTDYFSSFEDKLKKRLEAESELAEFPLLASISKHNTFSLPENYFTQAQLALEYKTELADYKSLSSIIKPAFNTLDAEYEKSFLTSIHHKIELAEELKPYSTLYALDKTNPFTVSEVYFETIADKVKEKIHSPKTQHVSVFDTVINFVFGKKMAYAFGLILICGLGFLFFNKPKAIDTTDCKTLACLEKQEIMNNAIITNFDDEQLLELVNVKTLNTQLKQNTTPTDSTQNEEYILDNINTDQLIEEL
jgi:hypothetical protein